MSSIPTCMESRSHKGGDVQTSPLSSDPASRCILLPVTGVIESTAVQYSTQESLLEYHSESYQNFLAQYLSRRTPRRPFQRSYQAYRGTCMSCRPSDDEPLMSRESDCFVFRRGRSQGPPYAHFSSFIQISSNKHRAIIFIPSLSNLLQYFHTSSDPSAQVTLISNSALGSNGRQHSLREIFGVSTVKSQHWRSVEPVVRYGCQKRPRRVISRPFKRR